MVSIGFFAYFSFAIVILSLLVVTRRNPVHSVLWMLLLFFHIASLYLFLNAEFMAAIQIIVYAGGILVLFLFVVLLMNLREELSIGKYISFGPTGFDLCRSALCRCLYVAQVFCGCASRAVYDRTYKKGIAYQGPGDIIVHSIPVSV